MYFSQFQWVSIDLKQQFGRKYPCIFNAESECHQRTCGGQPDLAWDDLWIVIPMFRTWEWWAMADWSTAFHSQNDTDPNDPNRFQYLTLFPYPLTMHQVLYYDSTCVVHECFFPFAPGILQRCKSFKSPWTIFKLQHENPGTKNGPMRMLAKTCIRFCQPETTHRTVEVMCTTVPNITQAQGICSQLPNLTPRNHPKPMSILSYPGTTSHRNMFFSHLFSDKSRGLSPIALGRYTQRLKDRRYSWNYRRARLLFETAWNLPPADGKIEAIAFWDAQARNIFYLNGNWKNSTKPMFFWVLVKTRDNFCGKWTKIVHSCGKCRKPCIFNISSTSDPIFDNPWEWSFSKCASWSIASK